MHGEVVTEQFFVNTGTMSGTGSDVHIQSSRGTKRQRSADDHCADCLPISKRINRLHIKPGDISSDEDAKEAPTPPPPPPVPVCRCGNLNQCNGRDGVLFHSKPQTSSTGSSTVSNKPSIVCPSSSSASAVHFSYSNRSQDMEDLDDAHSYTTHIHESQNNTQLINGSGGHGLMQGINSSNNLQHNGIVAGQSNTSKSHGKPPCYGIPENIGEVMMDLESYEPELSEAENPHYFQSNHRLFEVHRARMERMVRNGSYYTYQT